MLINSSLIDTKTLLGTKSCNNGIMINSHTHAVMGPSLTGVERKIENGLLTLAAINR